MKTTRGEVVVKEHTAKRYEIPATKKVVTVAEADVTREEEPQEPTQPIKRSPATGLCVWISEDSFIQEKKASLTMAKAIEAAGVERVVALNIPHDGAMLVSKMKHPVYSGSQQQLSNGYLLNTHSSTEAKKRMLDKIFKALQLGWSIEIVK